MYQRWKLPRHSLQRLSAINRALETPNNRPYPTQTLHQIQQAKRANFTGRPTVKPSLTETIYATVFANLAEV